MLDHATLSASQGPLTRSSHYGSRYFEHGESSAIVSDLAVTTDNLHKNLLSLQEAAQENFEIPSSLALARLFQTRFPWQEKKSSRFLFVGSLQALERQYSLRDREETLQLLERYPQLNWYLLEIHSHIVPYFPDTQFFLKAIVEPEAVDDLEVTDSNESLVVSVVTHMKPRKALEMLKQFYKDWWLKAPNRGKIKGKISFNLECV